MKTLDIVLILTWETELGVCDRFDLVSTAEKGENGTTVSIFKIKSYSSEMKLSWTTYCFFSLLILFILPRHSNSVNVWSWYIYLFHFLLQHQESNVYVQPNVSLLKKTVPVSAISIKSVLSKSRYPYIYVLDSRQPNSFIAVYKQA